MTNLVQFEVGDDHVATITLNRGDKMNAINAEMMAEIKRLWGVVRDEDYIHAVVFRADGNRAFSTGLDRVQGFQYPDNIWNKPDPGESLDPKHHKVWKPVITAVSGMCAGGAFYIVGGSDVVIASDDATFFDPHVDFGLVAALEPISMARRMPLGEILRVSLMGLEERMSAQRAHQIGLVSELVPYEELWARAHRVAAVIASKPSVSTQGTVRAIWESLDTGRSQAMSRGLSYTQLGNPLGIPQVENMLLTGKRKGYEVR
ncbi:enoyl-CoA hydratase/isomerase family protein [Pseudomonas sp. PDM24]|uniref:enoyl-CoA hydratase/isomerase family protein n=1 Tax=Pseudomonas sp. PDM24 TaxID=2854777 RepID=UPI001C46C0A7|nr:enoyl-CoA hydratase/isomerase family protein [Pseudomonas sp. PDM24]MBV7495092.1 enoyl-CoA hydratase/isomerase family protein [Pseudomonas sp. PDM24]